MSSNVDFKQVPEGVDGVNPDHPCKNTDIKILDAEAGLLSGTREKLALVGYASSTRDLAPFTDPTYDILGLNQLYRFIPRADLWTDIHDYYDEENVEGTDHEGWLRECGIPVLMNKTRPNIPTSFRYPIERVIEEGCDYFTSTVAFLIAWGIVQGYKEIALYGIDLIVGTEYEFQRQCAEFWLGVAHGRGITVRIPPQSALLKHSHRYGYEREPNVGLLTFSELEARQKALTSDRDQHLDKMKAIDGALHEVANRETWIDDPDGRLKWLREQRDQTMIQCATLDGAIQESAFQHQVLTLRSRGAKLVMPGTK